MPQLDIKFRCAIQGADKGVYPVLILDQYNNRAYVDRACGPEWVSIEKVRLMQFTGLVDKEGKEVYEGDIVKAAFMFDGKPSENPFNAVIVYNEHIAAFQLSYNSVGGMSSDEIYFCYQIEVIGNIRENADLMK